MDCNYSASYFTKLSVATLYRCPKSLERIGTSIICLMFIHRLKLKVTRLEMALTLDK
jgi:aryl-alcohol dehydrogenase-like predicted oxidoreductase